MGNFFVKQPNGLLARFSTYVDQFTHFHLTDEDARQVVLEEARHDAQRAVDYGHGEGFYKPRSWEDCLATVEEVHGEKGKAMAMESYDQGPHGEILILGGGTIAHVRPHLALSAPAYGKTAHTIRELLASRTELSREVILTRMAGGPKNVETNEDIARILKEAVSLSHTKIIFMSAALCDFTAEVLDRNSSGRFFETSTRSGKDQPRLQTSEGQQRLRLDPADKIIKSIRKERKDIFLVGFKTTAGATPDEQYLAGLNLLKGSSCNLVLANDLHTRLNMVITPEQARYHETTDRMEALTGLVEMALLRSKGTFTRSTVVGNPLTRVDWDEDEVPASLRRVVNHCIDRGAYKPFRGSTVGHFAFKVDDHTFITSKRKTDFNKLRDNGMVLVESTGPDNVVAHGAKPSVGGQSQRIIFKEHPDVDCIVHFHCPLKPDAPLAIPVREQRPYECGSHECGKNTSDGLQAFDAGPDEEHGGTIKAVMLDKHGPNIVFNRNTDPERVIQFIEANFDLAGRTDDVDPEVARAFA